MSFESTATVLPKVRPNKARSDRRVYPRFAPDRLGVTRVRLPNRSSAALVDVSSGGALLELPFQMRPDSRFGIQLDTTDAKVEVPLQVLRCYVADLRGGVVYHAAGAFDGLLDVRALAQRASSATQRLLTSLEQLERGVRSAAARTRVDAMFHETLTDVISWLKQSESLDLVVLKVKARLTQAHPSLAILPFQSRSFNPQTALECFGLTFQSKYPLSAQDRRFFKAHGQLLSMLEETRQALRDNERGESPLVIRTAAEWITCKPEPQPSPIVRPRTVAPPPPTPKPPPTKAPNETAESLRRLESLIFNFEMA